VTYNPAVKRIALLIAVVCGCIGCGGSQSTPNAGAYPIYNTVWSGTFTTQGSTATGTVTLTIDQNGIVTGIWQSYNSFVYAMSGTANTAGSFKGNMTATGQPSGTFDGALVTAGSGTNIQSATATGAITLFFGTTFTTCNLTLKYSGVPRFR